MSIRRLSPLLPLLAFLLATASSAATIEEEMRAVERIRGLRFQKSVRTATLARKDLPERLREQFIKTLPYSTEDWTTVVRALHLVDEAQGDLVGPMLQLYESQVLAYYDPLTGTYFAVRELPDAVQGLVPAAVIEEGIAVHELTHALQDQQFAIGRKDYALRKDTDANFAYHALLEGEASLVMLGYLAEKSGGSLDDIISNDLLMNTLAAATSSDAMMGPSTPRYFREMLKFPYLDGLRFVVEAYRRGGWEELNRIHKNLPRSTREILHPEEYFRSRDSGFGIRDSMLPNPESRITNPHSITEHLGEFHWGFFVGRDNARGWIDDRVIIAQDARCEPTVLAETVWESPEAARRFSSAYSRFLDDRGVGALTSIDGTRVKIAYGADPTLMNRFLR